MITDNINCTDCKEKNCDRNIDCNTCQEKMCPRKNMLKKIKAYSFAIIEMGLYLDTHPNDKKALCLHRRYANELNDLRDKYQKVYGPLSIDFPCNKWRWLEEPWPWEGGMN